MEKILLFLLLSFALPLSAHAEEPVRWSGTITIQATQTIELFRGNNCTLKNNFRLDVRLKEANPFVVSSEDNIIRMDLVDDGTTFAVEKKKKGGFGQV